MNVFKLFQKVLQWLNSPAKTIAGAIFWSLATVTTSFITAVGVVFVSGIRPTSDISDLAQQAAYAIAVVYAVFMPIIALMGAIFLVCLTGRSLYRLFKRGEHRKSQQTKPNDEKVGDVIPFEERKRSLSR